MFCNANTWTPGGGPPLATDNAFIGSNFPAGSAASATVTLTGNEAINTINLGVNVGTSGTLDLAGNTFSATSIFIGQFGGTGTINHSGGQLDTTNISVSGTNAFAFDALDSSSFGAIRNAANVTTAGIGNITDRVQVFDAGSTLNLGANLTLSADLDIRGTGTTVATVQANGFDISANSLFVGRFDNSGSLLNDGMIEVNQLQVDSSSLVMTGGDDIVNSLLRLEDASLLTVTQVSGESTGLTLNGDTLEILDTSVLRLQFDNGIVPGLDWAFRWANPTVGDRIGTINSLIGAGSIMIMAPASVSVFNNGGFTYIGFSTAIPEPSSLAFLMTIAVVRIMRRRRKVNR